MHDTFEVIAGCIFGAIVGIVLGLAIGEGHCKVIHSEAIDAGAAHYEADSNGRPIFKWNNGMRSSYQN
jgi:uncharacterized protein YcfJ